MRLVVVFAWVTAMTTGPALACPRDVLCVVRSERTGANEVARAITHVTVPERGSATGADPALPWIWQVLRDQVYARMPRYEQPKRFTLVLSPVVVASPADTVPGVGVAGNF